MVISQSLNLLIVAESMNATCFRAFKSMSELLVNEIFETIQGEGSYTGTPSIFVRLQGCPVGCAWCDTKHTWEIDNEFRDTEHAIYTKSGDSPSFFSTSSEALFISLQNQGYTARHIVITGGEPCMFDLTEFTGIAHDKGYSVQIETSGTFDVLCDERTWVTVSPKINMKGGYTVKHSAMHRANEIKHAIAMEKHIEELDELIKQSNIDNQGQKNVLIYLQPISQQQRATELAIKTCIERNWRLSVQLHKYIGVE